MIRATHYEVRCDAWDCEPDRFAPWSVPLRVEASSAAVAGKLAKAAGWRRAPSRGSWWCPRHVRSAEEARLRRLRELETGGSGS